MRKIFTILVMKEEIEGTRKILNDYQIKEDDMDMTKVFNVQGNEVVYFVLVTDEETFTSIVRDLNGLRVY